MQHYAHQACIRCRNQKRKCSRLLPTCSRCKRLSLRCQYQGIEDDHKSPDSSGITQFALVSLSQSVQSHVFAIVGDDEAIALSATRFFSTIHSWFPVINRDSYCTGLSRPRSKHSPDFSLLKLCVHLLGLYPTDGNMSSQMHGLYILATGLAASITAAGVSSLNLLQARILLSFFEIAHGMYTAAYISMGANMRAAAAMSPLPSQEAFDRLESSDAVEDVHRVWGCLVTLDRYASLEMAKVPGPNELDSFDSEAQDLAVNDLLRASCLLEEALIHVYKPAPYDVKYDEAMPLIESLVMLRDSLGTNEKPALSCPATAICRSALIIMMENGHCLDHPPGKDCSPLSIALLQADVEQFVTVCKDFMEKASSSGSIDIPVFFVHTIGTAALMILRYLCDSSTTNAMSSVHALQRLLEAMSNRWLGASLYFEKIQREIDLSA
ncbi:hypothetical protein BJX64DRAFT_20733 [Aspergillus heterothallicus]